MCREIGVVQTMCSHDLREEKKIENTSDQGLVYRKVLPL